MPLPELPSPPLFPTSGPDSRPEGEAPQPTAGSSRGLNDYVIRLRDIEKTYRRGSVETRVLLGVDLRVRRGESVFLAGPSGCGKSTLLSILGCILTADRGEVEIMGQDLQRMDDAARTLLRRQHLGFIFQRFQLVRGLSARDNVSIPLRIRGVPPKEALHRADETLDEVGLSDKRQAKPHQLSGGQSQRVAIARALAADPELILADEPTASLDEENGRQIMELFRRLVRQHHKTAIVVTHDQRVFSYADRVLHLSQGRIAPPPTELPPVTPMDTTRSPATLPPLDSDSLPATPYTNDP
jgi:putative ABC transport system ATP-binding protein